jgi:hypothetical protein
MTTHADRVDVVRHAPRRSTHEQLPGYCVQLRISLPTYARCEFVTEC